MEEILNTFEGGMVSGTDFTVQPKNTYRNSINGKIVNLYGGSYTWESSNGTALSFEITDRHILGHINSPEKLFIFSYDPSNPEICEIGYVEKASSDGNNTYTPLYVSDQLNFSSNNPDITGYYNLETTNIERIYWNDEVNEPKVLNIAKLTQTYTRNTLSQLQYNSWYLVLRGWVKHADETYSTIGQVFKKTQNLLDAYADGEGTLLVLVNEAHPDILPFTPDCNVGVMTFDGVIGGTMMTGNYYVGVRFLCDGYKGQFSPLSGPYSIYKQYTGSDWKNYKAIPNRTSNKGLGFTISNIPDGFDRVEYCVFKQTDDGNLQEGILIGPYDIPVSGDLTLNLTNYSGATFPLSNYIKSTLVFENFKDMTTIFNNSVVVNGELLSLTGSEQTIPGDVEEAYYEIPADAYYNQYKDTPTLPNVDMENGVASGDILVGQFYKVYDAPVNYNGTTIPAGECFVGLASVYNFYTSGGKVFPVYRIPQYTKRGSGEVVFKEITAKDAHGYRGSASSILAGYWGEETYRIGILPISTKGTLMPIRHLKDITLAERSDSVYKTNYTVNGSSGAGPFGISKSYDRPVGLNVRKDLMTKTAYLLCHVDLTDIIDDIKGFCIVRAPRDKQIISEGYVMQMWTESYSTAPDGVSVFNIERRRLPEYWHTGASPYKPTKYVSYSSPLFVCNLDDHQSLGGEYLHHVRSMKTPQHFQGPSPLTNDRTKSSTYYTSYVQGAGVQFDTFINAIAPTDMSVRLTAKVLSQSVSEEAQIIDDPNPDVVVMDSDYDVGVYNIVQALYGDPHTHDNWPKHFDYGQQYLFTAVEDNEDFRTDALGIHTYQYVRPKSNLYGGSDPNALQESSYIFTGHYQEVTNEFKQAIYSESDGKYYAYNIGIFGGDCYTGVFCEQRLIPSIVTGDVFPNCRTYHNGHIVKLPVQSEINPYAFYGEDIYQVGERKAYGASQDMFGSDWFTDFHVNNYSKQFNNELIGLPFKAYQIDNVETAFRNRLWYSPDKIDGEEEDAFRNYPVNNYLNIPGRDGEIINIRAKLSRLYCWQKNAVSYIPVSERALQANELGLPIQLGVGGKFSRSDKATRSGNFFKSGLCETESGFVWYDQDRYEIMYITAGLEESELNRVLGTKEILLDAFNDYDIYSVKSGYDHSDKSSFVTITASSGGRSFAKTLTFNEDVKKFESEQQLYPVIYMPFRDRMLLVQNGSGADVFLNNVQGSATMMGRTYGCSLEVVIGGGIEGAKRFVSQVMKATNEFFDTVIFQSAYDYFDRQFNNTVTDDSTEISRNYTYVNREWRWGVPLEGSEQDFDDSFIVITFSKTTVSEKIKASYLKTFYNRRY